jgi:hypothetical protein
MERTPVFMHGRINIVEMVTLKNAIFPFNAIPIIKILVSFLAETEKSILKFIWKHKRPQYQKQS